ncbi:hypothetical protein METBIDRAFT_76546 [Metschnikowia bicuspidata var. bicuspidata NRRL YB-4993]|uniref:Polyprenal reductase n=1 Tax=Metschnikowia bicuspidata var. bicuspidata NRRL YB-4993 TaxID=869754 RepID=A0A1A0HHS1_9ASCO|nr:hypothetical protein METBIDRAFT_76546 [Metschnikowia bicuspidata var. bicuspidata NRRL YB-4993]OBA23551.1 hypothetical protein METBIDRAFT_76546 [Metschnikowia bicuspidata var. bicuspidata NRRL YB-4993]
MIVAHAISASFAVLSVFLLALIQFNDLSVLVYYGKVAQGRLHQNLSPLATLFNGLAKLTVPKAWFAHFYILYLALMWSQVVLYPKSILENGKYTLVWLFLTCQASRRLYESFNVSRWSPASRMNVSHYLMGMLFYVGVSAACLLGLLSQDPLEEQKFSLLHKAWVGGLGLLFLLSQIDQYRNHKYLASLVKYSAPKNGVFCVVSSAHYLDEIVAYFCVVLLVFTRGQIVAEDWSLLSIWLFIVINLSISACETHKYYKQKFDDYSVRFALIPGLI